MKWPKGWSWAQLEQLLCSAVTEKDPGFYLGSTHNVLKLGVLVHTWTPPYPHPLPSSQEIIKIPRSSQLNNCEASL